MRRIGKGGLDLGCEFRRVNHRRRLRILNIEAVIFSAQKRVKRNRNKPGFDRTPESIKECRAVFDHEQNSIPGPDIHGDEGVSATVHVFCQSGITDVVDAVLPDNNFIAAPFIQMPVYKINRDIKCLGKFELGRCF